MPMAMQTFYRNEAGEARCHEDNSKGTDGSPTDEYDPWNPPCPPFNFPSDVASMNPQDKLRMQIIQFQDFVSKARATSIIVPDRTPQKAVTKFIGICKRLGDILQKDSVPSFIRLSECKRDCMAWGFILTPQTFDMIIIYNALRCAKLVLEAKRRKMRWLRANPNYITSFGYFPLHQAAETFSVDMIKLLLHFGASANLRTSGEEVIEGLLPLHVAIENTCQHKYLEDNLLADQKHIQANSEYIYKLIHLLCLPEMKIFLDTIRVLASHTDNVVGELWNYIEHGKLVPAAILLLAAQKQFLNEFGDIKTRIDDSRLSLEREVCGLGSGKNTKARKQLLEKRAFLRNAWLLLVIVSKSGEALHSYIQTHSEASHQEVLGKVSAILQEYDVAPIGKGIGVEDLYCCPYDCGVPDSVLNDDGNVDMTNAALGSSTRNDEAKNAVIKKPPRIQDLECARNIFFPHWRSVLTAQFTARFFPSYAPEEEWSCSQELDMASSGNKLKDKGSSPIRLGLLGCTSNYQSRRLFGTVASTGLLRSTCNYQPRRLFGIAASTVLKMLKRA